MNIPMAAKIRYSSSPASVLTSHDTLLGLANANLSEFQDVSSPQQISIQSPTPQPILGPLYLARYGTIVAVFLVPVLIFLVSAIATRFFRLRSVPGPFWAAYSRLWLVRTLASGESAAAFVDVNKTYGEWTATDSLSRLLYCMAWRGSRYSQSRKTRNRMFSRSGPCTLCEQ